jgi:hypothetical protein
MGVNVESMFLVFDTDNGLEGLLICLVIVQVIVIGCAISAPDGSSPRGYGPILVVEHRLKTMHTLDALFLPLMWMRRLWRWLIFFKYQALDG